MVFMSPTPIEERLRHLRAIAEPTRLRLLRLLTLTEMNVTELTTVIGQSQPSISRHLKILADAGLVARHQDGGWVLYRATAGPVILGLVEALSGEDVAADDAALAHVSTARADAAADYFAGQADQWDSTTGGHGWEDAVSQATEAIIKGIAKPLGGQVERLIDLGTGTGQILLDLSPYYREAIGYDVNAAMLAVARSKLYDAGAHSARVRRADLYDLGAMQMAAEVVVLHQVLHYLPDPRAGFAIAAGLARGGHMVVADVATHQFEDLREHHTHRRLGFSGDELGVWASENNAEVIDEQTFEPNESGRLTAKLWTIAVCATGTALTTRNENESDARN